MLTQDVRFGETSDNKHDDNSQYDVVIIGAGLHGVSMACEASTRGLNTLLVQAGNIGGTSSCTPCGVFSAGLNQQDSFSSLPELLTNLNELDLLHMRAPHLARPITTHFINTPHYRPSTWQNIRLGLYQWLQKKKTPSVSAQQTQPIHHEEYDSLYDSFIANTPSKIAIPEFSISFSRIVIALVQQLENNGAITLMHHRLEKAERHCKHWQLHIRDLQKSTIKDISAKVLINCGGCYVDDLLKQTLDVKTRSSANRQQVTAQIFVKHPQDWHTAAVLKDEDDGLIYAQHFDDQHLCVGPIVAKEDSPEAKQEAIEHFLELWNQRATSPLKQEDIIHCQWSLRAVIDDPTNPQNATGNTSYLDLNNPGNQAPLLSLFGNNMIQHRRLAQQGLDILQPFTGQSQNASTATQPLPGGDFNNHTLHDALESIFQKYKNLPHALLTRLMFTYGTKAEKILDQCTTLNDLGHHFGHGLYEREVRYLMQYEWAENEQDILWRRTYLGFHFTSQENQDLHNFIQQAA